MFAGRRPGGGAGTRPQQPSVTSTNTNAVKVTQVNKLGNKITSVQNIVPRPVTEPGSQQRPPSSLANRAATQTRTGAPRAGQAQSKSDATPATSDSVPRSNAMSRLASNASSSSSASTLVSTQAPTRTKPGSPLTNGKHSAAASTSRLKDSEQPSRSVVASSSAKRPAFNGRTSSPARTTAVAALKHEHAQRASSEPAAKKRKTTVTEPTTLDRTNPSTVRARSTAKTPKSNGNGNGKARAGSDSEQDEGGYQSDSSEEDGTPGLGGGSIFSRKRELTPVVERNVANDLDGDVVCVSGAQLVESNRKAYLDYFVDLTDTSKPASEWCGLPEPQVMLEYPSRAGKEKFLLLAPKEEDEYNPITDIITTIRTVLDHFLTPAQAQALFSHMQGPSSFSAFLSAPVSRSGTPGTPTETASPAAAPSPPLMRALEKAKAKKDGPGFIAEVERFNTTMRLLKDDGKMADNIRAMPGLKQPVWQKIAAQAYERAVGPGIEELRNYPAFSDNVYGELLPRFMAEIFQKTKMSADSVFVDFGSGVGNCVVQAALATGCEAWGFENMKHASSLARDQVVEAQARCRLWGVKSGPTQVVEADFCEHPQVGEVLKRADVILVNNEVFTSALNERLSLLFLDLKSGTQIVSLKAFASSFSLSAHNRHSPLAIIRQGSALRYPRNSVSWKSESGTYFIGTVDRTMLEKFDRQEQARQERSGR